MIQFAVDAGVGFAAGADWAERMLEEMLEHTRGCLKAWKLEG